MKFKNQVVAVFVLTAISIYLTLYTIEVHIVASNYIFEDPSTKGLAWRSGPSGTFLPWPRRPGPLQILSGVNSVDVFIYEYMVKFWILVGLSVLLWFIATLCVLKAFRTWRCGNIALAFNGDADLADDSLSV